MYRIGQEVSRPLYVIVFILRKLVEIFYCLNIYHLPYYAGQTLLKDHALKQFSKIQLNGRSHMYVFMKNFFEAFFL